jgi:hypothetical protein
MSIRRMPATLESLRGPTACPGDASSTASTRVGRSPHGLAPGFDACNGLLGRPSRALFVPPGRDDTVVLLTDGISQLYELLTVGRYVVPGGLLRVKIARG